MPPPPCTSCAAAGPLPSPQFLEFQADPTSASHKPELGGGRKLVFYCGSGSRSALGAKSLKEIGIENAAYVAGGFAALKQAGAATQDGEAS